MENTEEIWKNLDFIGAPGYEVSNFGRIRNVKVKTKRILAGFLNRKKHPYRQVILTLNGNPKAFRVCRLVAMAFVANPDPINKLFVDHIDGDPLNDNASNLRWVTHEENMANPITRERLKASLKGVVPWNKGIKTGPMSEKGRNNIREGIRKYWENKRKSANNEA